MKKSVNINRSTDDPNVVVNTQGLLNYNDNMLKNFQEKWVDGGGIGRFKRDS